MPRETSDKHNGNQVLIGEENTTVNLSILSVRRLGRGVKKRKFLLRFRDNFLFLGAVSGVHVGVV